MLALRHLQDLQIPIKLDMNRSSCEYKGGLLSDHRQIPISLSLKRWGTSRSFIIDYQHRSRGSPLGSHRERGASDLNSKFLAAALTPMLFLLVYVMQLLLATYWLEVYDVTNSKCLSNQVLTNFLCFVFGTHRSGSLSAIYVQTSGPRAGAQWALRQNLVITSLDLLTGNPASGNGSRSIAKEFPSTSRNMKYRLIDTHSGSPDKKLAHHGYPSSATTSNEQVFLGSLIFCVNSLNSMFIGMLSVSKNCVSPLMTHGSDEVDLTIFKGIILSSTQADHLTQPLSCIADTGTENGKCTTVSLDYPHPFMFNVNALSLGLYTYLKLGTSILTTLSNLLWKLMDLFRATVNETEMRSCLVSTATRASPQAPLSILYHQLTTTTTVRLWADSWLSKTSCIAGICTYTILGPSVMLIFLIVMCTTIPLPLILPTLNLSNSPRSSTNSTFLNRQTIY